MRFLIILIYHYRQYRLLFGQVYDSEHVFHPCAEPTASYSYCDAVCHLSFPPSLVFLKGSKPSCGKGHPSRDTAVSGGSSENVNDDDSGCSTMRPQLWWIGRARKTRTTYLISPYIFLFLWQNCVSLYDSPPPSPTRMTPRAHTRGLILCCAIPREAAVVVLAGLSQHSCF